MRRLDLTGRGTARARGPWRVCGVARVRGRPLRGRLVRARTCFSAGPQSSRGLARWRGAEDRGNARKSAAATLRVARVLRNSAACAPKWQHRLRRGPRRDRSDRPRLLGSERAMPTASPRHGRRPLLHYYSVANARARQNREHFRNVLRQRRISRTRHLRGAQASPARPPQYARADRALWARESAPCGRRTNQGDAGEY